MTPEIQEGDFVVISKIPFLTGFCVGDRIVFRHPQYGTLIKCIEKMDDNNKIFWVGGYHPRSLDSHKIGPIREDQIYGKVIWHIRRS